MRAHARVRVWIYSSACTYTNTHAQRLRANTFDPRERERERERDPMPFDPFPPTSPPFDLIPPTSQPPSPSLLGMDTGGAGARHTICGPRHHVSSPRQRRHLRPPLGAHRSCTPLHQHSSSCSMKFEIETYRGRGWPPSTLLSLLSLPPFLSSGALCFRVCAQGRLGRSLCITTCTQHFCPSAAAAAAGGGGLRESGPEGVGADDFLARAQGAPARAGRVLCSIPHARRRSFQLSSGAPAWSPLFLTFIPPPPHLRCLCLSVCLSVCLSACAYTSRSGKR